MSRHGHGGQNQWAMSPEPAPPSGPSNPRQTIKKESWRPAAQSTWVNPNLRQQTNDAQRTNGEPSRAPITRPRSRSRSRSPPRQRPRLDSPEKRDDSYDREGYAGRRQNGSLGPDNSDKGNERKDLNLGAIGGENGGRINFKLGVSNRENRIDDPRPLDRLDNTRPGDRRQAGGGRREDERPNERRQAGRRDDERSWADYNRTKTARDVDEGRNDNRDNQRGTTQINGIQRRDDFQGRSDNRRNTWKSDDRDIPNGPRRTWGDRIQRDRSPVRPEPPPTRRPSPPGQRHRSPSPPSSPPRGRPRSRSPLSPSTSSISKYPARNDRSPPRPARARSPVSVSRGRRRESPDYGIGGRAASTDEELHLSRPRDRITRDASPGPPPVRRLPSTPPSPRRNRPRSPSPLPRDRSPSPRKRSPPPSTSAPPAKRSRHSPSRSSSYTSRRRYSSSSYSRSPTRSASPPPARTAKNRAYGRRSPSPQTRSVPAPRNYPPQSPPRRLNDHPPRQRSPIPPPRDLNRPSSPRRSWGRQPLPDQTSLFDSRAPPPRAPYGNGPDRALNRQSWSDRRNDRPPSPPVEPPRSTQPSQQEGPTASHLSLKDLPANGAYGRTPEVSKMSIPQSPPRIIRASTPPPPTPPPVGTGFKIDLTAARAPVNKAKTAVRHIFDDATPPSTATTASFPSPTTHSPIKAPNGNHRARSPSPPPPPRLEPSPVRREAVPALEVVPTSAKTPEAKLAEHQRSYSDHLNTIAPYIQAAFTQWFNQNTTPALPEFLGYYFGRPPNEGEVEQIRQLLDRRRRLMENETELQSLIKGGRLTEAKPEPENGRNKPNQVKASIPEPKPEEVRPSKKLADDEVYERLACVGEGTYGKVYKARNVDNGQMVALKRIRMEGEKDGFPVTAMREIKLLQVLNHPNIVTLLEMMVSKGSVYMVLGYMEHDLTGLLAHPEISFSPAHLKSLNYQMLDGLSYLHDRSILHRDLKGSNILLSSSGILKLADFGLARFYSKKRKDDYTNRVITLWYRSPELLLGETVYGPEVDIWSAGCIFLELFTTKPVFQGNDEINQLEVIWNLMGTPDKHDWSDVEDLPWYELVKPGHPLPDRFNESFGKYLSPKALELVRKLLEFDPKKRISAKEAMQQEYFTVEMPKMEKPVNLKIYGEQHEMDAKASRRKKAELNGERSRGSGSGSGARTGEGA